MKASYTAYSDYELITSLKQGNHAAFTEIYDRNWGSLYIHALKLLHDEDESKDIVQEIFITLWSKSEDLCIQTTLSAYLFAAVRNKVLNKIRDKKVRSDYTSLFSLYIDQHSDSALAKINENELSQAIEKVIQSLPEKMKVVFELSRKAYLTHKEIAEQLNISEGTVKKQVGNALKIIKSTLDKPITVILAAILFDIKN